MFPCCIIALGNWCWSWEQGFANSHSQECILGYATCNQVSSICTTKSTNIDFIGKKRKSCESGATSSSSSSKKPVHEAVNRCGSSMSWIRVQKLSQHYWPLLLDTVMHKFLHLLLLSYLWYSPILGFRRVVLHMHQFVFFSLSSLLSFSISLHLQTLVQVLHRDIARVPSQGLVRYTNHWVHLL